jgi:sigma-B regulation protein RsbU (phosphoserine phosphatase)
MYASDATLTASQVLKTFHRDELYIFLGAAFTTVGLISIAFAFLGRKVNALLIWLAVFAILYGQRLWLQLGLLALMVPPSGFFDTLRESSNYLVPIPAFFYFQSAGFLGRFGRRIVFVLTFLFLSLFFGTIVFGTLRIFPLINNVLVIACLFAVVVQSFQHKAADKDFVIIRRGLLVFAAFALYNNISAALGRRADMEAIGFACFLGTLGYVAAQRTLHRDRQLDEIQKELDVARRIQSAILPSGFPKSAHFDVATRYAPMTSVAGDFYDFLVANDNEAGILIADVSGHGVPAALIASMVKLAATSQRAHSADPAALLSGMNAALCGNTQNQFVTAAYVHLDAASARLRYSAAAHPPMLLVRGDNVIQIVENGLMLAAFSTATYSSAEQPLHAGDRLVLYTDGIIEAANEKEEEFGQERLCTLLREGARLTPQETADHIIASVQSWSKSQSDDLTVVVCDHRTVAGKIPKE